MQSSFRLARRLTIFMALVFAPCFLVLLIKVIGTNNGASVKLFLALLGFAAIIILALLGHARVRDHEFRSYIKDLHNHQEIPGKAGSLTRSMYYIVLFLLTEPISWITKLPRRLRRRDRGPQTIEMIA